jgi:hypothetical protein
MEIITSVLAGSGIREDFGKLSTIVTIRTIEAWVAWVEKRLHITPWEQGRTPNPILIILARSYSYFLA